jgi:hypothetical protein
MKTTRIFFMAALALTFAACSNDDNDITIPEPAKAEGITITAQLAPKDGGTTRAVSEDAVNKKIVAKWAVNEHIAILYSKDGNQVADARITAVNGTTGVATIEFTVMAGTANNTPCTLVYPLSAAKDDHTGVKAYADLLATQDGVLDGDLDVRVGAGTIQTTTPGLTVTTQPAAQFAIFKFTLSGPSIDATHPLVIKDGSENVITTVTPASTATSVYVAMPPAASSTYKFIVTTDNNKYIKSGTAAITAGKYYQTTLAMSARYPLALASATVDDLGSMITNDGYICLNAAGATAASKTAVAMIAYVGSDNGESSPFNHGLALALTDANGGNTCKWSTSNTKIHTYNPTISSFASDSESGLQYNDATHNSDTYPAFKAAIANNGTAKPTTGCSDWFLASGYQWKQMFTAAGGAANLKTNAAPYTGLESYYWSSSEKIAEGAWFFTSDDGNWYPGVKHNDDLVRACLAF